MDDKRIYIAVSGELDEADRRCSLVDNLFSANHHMKAGYAVYEVVEMRKLKSIELEVQYAE